MGKRCRHELETKTDTPMILSVKRWSGLKSIYAGCTRTPASSRRMVAREETPEGWGLLFVHDKRVTIEVEPPYHSDLEIQAAEHSLFYSLLRRAELRG